MSLWSTVRARHRPRTAASTEAIARVDRSDIDDAMRSMRSSRPIDAIESTDRCDRSIDRSIESTRPDPTPPPRARSSHSHDYSRVGVVVGVVGRLDVVPGPSDARVTGDRGASATIDARSRSLDDSIPRSAFGRSVARSGSIRSPQSVLDVEAFNVRVRRRRRRIEATDDDGRRPREDGTASDERVHADARDDGDGWWR